MRRPAGGFTLIEVLVVLVILGILIAFALPGYQEQVRKGRRSDAQSVLMRASQFMERFYTENQRYEQDIAGVAVSLPASLTQAPVDGATKYYTLSLLSVTEQAYTLQAEPSGSQVGDRCGTMTVTHTGVTGVVNAPASATTSDCWRR